MTITGLPTGQHNIITYHNNPYPESKAWTKESPPVWPSIETVAAQGLRSLATLEGRATDFVIAADGTVMHGLALIYVLREMPEVGAFNFQLPLLLPNTSPGPASGRCMTRGWG